jgi:hypothetical protein
MPVKIVLTFKVFGEDSEIFYRLSDMEEITESCEEKDVLVTLKKAKRILSDISLVFDDTEECRVYLSAWDNYRTLADLSENLRSKLKYCDLSEEQAKTYHEIRQWIFDNSPNPDLL